MTQILKNLKINLQIFFLPYLQSLEYTDSIHCRGVKSSPHKKKKGGVPGDDTKLHLMLRPQINLFKNHLYSVGLQKT